MRHPNLEYIGQTATFYIPAEKLDQVRSRLHEFFIRSYNAYTFESSNIQGYWRSGPGSPIFDDRNVKYVVSFDGRDRVDGFIEFLSDVCARIEEECIYLTMGMKSFLVKPRKLGRYE